MAVCIALGCAIGPESEHCPAGSHPSNEASERDRRELYALLRPLLCVSRGGIHNIAMLVMVLVAATAPARSVSG